jgi:murein L,D-transpeptidase YcbB/YkuD
MLFDDKDQNLALIKLDILLSDAFFALTRDLSLGQIDYRDFRNILYKKAEDEDINHRWEANVAEHDYTALLQKAKHSGDFSQIIYSLASDNVIYNSLKDAYIRYKSIQDQGGFQKISKGKNLKIGDTSDRVKELRIRLNQSGDLDFSDEDNKKFDKELRDGLKKFQKRVGIWHSGVLNSTTKKALNVSLEERLAKIKLNLERSRWESDDFDFRYIIVNIPEFMMHFKEGDELLMNARVIVGKLKNPTPIFKANMSYIVLNPRWSVPNSIVSKEMLRKIQDDPYYLEDRGFKTYDRWKRKGRKEIDSFDVDWFQYDEDSKIPFNIVKEPGSSNPLGNVKFMFPNNHAVYIHDTPKKKLFKKSVRAFSHGCIRLHKPQKLLEFVSEGYLGSSYRDIKSKLNTGNNISLGMNEKIPVYVRYYTAYVDENGAVVFTKDLYGYDKIAKKLLLRK